MDSDYDGFDINSMDIYMMHNNPPNNNVINNNSNSNVQCVNNNNEVMKKCPCNQCIVKFIQCEICKGFYLHKFFNEKHNSLCKTLYKTYQETTDLVICTDCSLRFKCSDYSSHIDNCPSTSFRNFSIECQICNQIFSLDVIEEHESTCDKMQTNIMLLKETTQCDFCNEMIPLIQIEVHETSCKKLSDNQENIDKLMVDSGEQAPEFWQINNPKARKVSQGFHMVPVDPNTEEYSNIKGHFNTCFEDYSYGITSLWRIQNESLLKKYNSEKNRIQIEKDFVEERMLFFGNKNINPEHICKNGFDISFSVDKSTYGRGIYFKVRSDSVIDNSYKKNKNDPSSFIFLANVLTGITYVPEGEEHNLRKPPFYDEARFIYYDSVSNIDNFSFSKLEDQTYVIYNNEKAYPLYVIEFNSLNKIYN